MMQTNIEIKARCTNPKRTRDLLLSAKADFRGTDHQTDTYFRVNDGRLKCRECNIENALIHYRRPDSSEPKPSYVNVIPNNPDSGLKEALTSALGILVTVAKEREIYFIENTNTA